MDTANSILNEVTNLIQRKEYSALVKERVKYLNIFRDESLDELLQDRKEAFDQDLKSLLKKYKIAPDNIDAELNILWKEVDAEPVHKQVFQELSLIMWGNKSPEHVSFYLDIIGQKWDWYKVRVHSYVEELINNK